MPPGGGKGGHPPPQQASPAMPAGWYDHALDTLIARGGDGRDENERRDDQVPDRVARGPPRGLALRGGFGGRLQSPGARSIRILVESQGDHARRWAEVGKRDRGECQAGGTSENAPNKVAA